MNCDELQLWNKNKIRAGEQVEATQEHREMLGASVGIT